MTTSDLLSWSLPAWNLQPRSWGEDDPGPTVLKFPSPRVEPHPYMWELVGKGSPLLFVLTLLELSLSTTELQGGNEKCWKPFPSKEIPLPSTVS